MEEKYRPLKPFSYFGYNLLFSLPVIGLIFLIIFSFNDKNINRRNFARSFFCGYAILLIIAVILFVLNFFFVGVTFKDIIEEIMYY